MARKAQSQWTIHDVEFLVTRRRMKHLRIAVHPPDGEARVSAPRYVSNAEIQEFICERLPWVKEQQAYFRSQPKAPLPQLVSGEEVRIFDDTFKLNLCDSPRNRKAVWLQDESLMLRANDGDSIEKKQKRLDSFYREILREAIPRLLDKWQPVIGVHAKDWGIKKMKTRWGSCSISAARIWLNLDLIHYPKASLEYVVVHELTHLIEANHSPRFWNLIDNFLPEWREAAEPLKSSGSL